LYSLKEENAMLTSNAATVGLKPIDQQKLKENRECGQLREKQYWDARNVVNEDATSKP